MYNITLHNTAKLSQTSANKKIRHIIFRQYINSDDLMVDGLLIAKSDRQKQLLSEYSPAQQSALQHIPGPGPFTHLASIREARGVMKGQRHLKSAWLAVYIIPVPNKTTGDKMPSKGRAGCPRCLLPAGSACLAPRPVALPRSSPDQRQAPFSGTPSASRSVQKHGRPRQMGWLTQTALSTPGKNLTGTIYKSEALYMKSLPSHKTVTRTIYKI